MTGPGKSRRYWHRICKWTCERVSWFPSPSETQDILVKKVSYQLKNSKTKEDACCRGCVLFGVKKENITRFEYPDFSLGQYAGNILPGGDSGAFLRIVDFIREKGITRALIPNGYREHYDHTAAYHVVGELLENIKLLLINMTAMFNPDMIIFRGGLEEKISKYFPDLESALRRTIPYVPVLSLAKCGSYSGMYGAVAVAKRIINADYRNISR